MSVHQDEFYQRISDAEKAGLSHDWVMKVAYLECSLSEAIKGFNEEIAQIAKKHEK